MFLRSVNRVYISSDFFYRYVLQLINRTEKQVQFILISDDPEWSRINLSPNMTKYNMSHVFALQFHKFLPQDIEVLLSINTFIFCLSLNLKFHFYILKVKRINCSIFSLTNSTLHFWPNVRSSSIYMELLHFGVDSDKGHVYLPRYLAGNSVIE